jgi:acetyl esterase/lipase
VGWDRTLMTPLASDLARRGIAAWNVEYRRVGQAGGGWPGTFDDVAAAVDHLLGVPEVDPRRIVTCGHSAGGHLALWAAARPRLPEGAPGSGPRVQVRGAVALAAVCDLERAWRDDLGAGAVTGLVGSFDDVQDRYAYSSPSALRPIGVPQLIVHGTADEIVPLSQSQDYAGADSRAEFVVLEGADHFDVVDPAHASWKVVVDRLPAMLPQRRFRPTSSRRARWPSPPTRRMHRTSSSRGTGPPSSAWTPTSAPRSRP